METEIGKKDSKGKANANVGCVCVHVCIERMTKREKARFIL